MQVPDLTERVIGFRQWYPRWSDEDERYWLKPVGKPDAPPWKSGPQHARCYAKHGEWYAPCLPVVNDDCDCGFYALHDLESATEYGPRSDRQSVQGVVSAWGRIAVHETGFRAEWIELMAIIVPPEVPKSKNPESHYHVYKRVAEDYGVPLMEYDRAEGFAEEFGKKIPKSLYPSSVDPDGIVYDDDGEEALSGRYLLNHHRQLAAQYARSRMVKTPDGLPQWLMDVMDEIDFNCPEAMAGLYDIYVPNLGDLLMAVVEIPKPTYLKFPDDKPLPAAIDPGRTFSEFICTNGCVAYLPESL